MADRSQFLILIFTLITNNLALTYSLKYDNANKMRQCENIFVFIDLTKLIGSDLGGQCPPPPNSAYGVTICFMKCSEVKSTILCFGM